MNLASHLASIKPMGVRGLKKIKEGDSVIISLFNNKKRVKFVVSEVSSDSLIFIKEKSGIEIMIDTLNNRHVDLNCRAYPGVYICQN